MPCYCLNPLRKPGEHATSQPLVSVVTPVHNGAEHLADCIRSVLAQNYQAWEYVIVNNASTDGSLELAQSFAALDPRIRVVQTEHLLPAALNHNFALLQISAASSYCKMVFADDWIYPNCLAEMVSLAETDPEIAIVGALYLKGAEICGHGLPCHAPDLVTSVVTGRDLCRLCLLEDLFVLGSPNTMLYRSSLVRSRQAFFPEFKYQGYFNDTHSYFEFLEQPKVGFIHQVLSYSRWGNDSITTSTMTLNMYHLMRYMMLLKYGNRYLTDAEYHDAVAEVNRSYYDLLAQSVFHGRGSKFWQYHARGLEVAGSRLDWRRLARMQLPRLFIKLGNPQQTMAGLWRQFRSMDATRRLLSIPWINRRRQGTFASKRLGSLPTQEIAR
jgi:glycosyltransferase involved in cell wall biosynthesis